MSSFLAPTRARVRIADAVQQRTRLSVVRASHPPAPRVPFAALVLTVLALGLVGLLVLNTSLQQGAFHARRLEARAEALTEKRQALELQVAQLRRPQRVAERAAAMGMVPNQNPAFLRLSDGAVLGRTSPASASTAPQFLSPPRVASAAPGRDGRSGGAPDRTSQGSGR